ncbi:hypothetical protein KBP30_00990 [Streptomyces sp. Go40/10]|uniref:hypothetical protein n=1 Tax=Streptomyces sp. Go40/10 TaxID=2825844 RepID=UPI001E47F77E|nr:hypothetical protein [Streptomyces sp. Go40/10]UFQ99884.1 hypothetical protein KBP30_00990 [Streptomyces sp. Go40/10]
MAIGDVAHVDLLGGRVTFTQTKDTTVRVSGQFKEGVPNFGARVVLRAGDQVPPLDLTADPPGTAEFEHDYEDVDIIDFAGASIQVILNNTETIAVGTATRDD